MDRRRFLSAAGLAIAGLTLPKSLLPAKAETPYEWYPPSAKSLSGWFDQLNKAFGNYSALTSWEVDKNLIAKRTVIGSVNFSNWRHATYRMHVVFLEGEKFTLGPMWDCPVIPGFLRRRYDLIYDPSYICKNHLQFQIVDVEVATSAPIP